MKIVKQTYVMAVLSIGLAIAGCETRRCGAVARVDDVGPEITTRYRYRLVRSPAAESFLKETGTSSNVAAKAVAKVMGHVSMVEAIAFPGFCRDDYHADSPYKNEELRQEYPQVFSDDGIEFKIHRSNLQRDSKYSWTMLPCICSLTLFPCFTCNETTLAYNIEIPEAEKGKSSFEVMYFNECAESIWPTALLALSDEPSVGEGLLSYKSDKMAGLAEGANHLAGQIKTHLELLAFRKKAFAYAVAKRLKELEDSGVVDELLRKREAEKSKAPPHRVERLSRDSEKDFAYDFALELESVPSNPSETVRAVIHDFAKAIVEDYADTFPHAKKDLLRVAFSGVSISGMKISGKASVLTIAPLSLSYDANTRRGMLSVRFNPGQADESRKWILENIATLARDKNIMLTTGSTPPPGSFSICEEKVDGSTLEIEFKTE